MEKRHGRIWCEERVKNNERRDRSELVRGSANVPRSIFEAIRDCTKGLNDNRGAQQAAEPRADQQRTAAELTAQGREMHQAYREELAGFAADYRRDKVTMIETGREERHQLREQTRIAFQEAMAELFARQRQELQTVALPAQPRLERVRCRQDGRKRSWQDRQDALGVGAEGCSP